MTPEKRKVSASAKAADNAAQAPPPDPPPKRKYNKTRVQKIHAKKDPAAKQIQQQASLKDAKDFIPSPTIKKAKCAPLPIVGNDDLQSNSEDLLSIAESGVLEASIRRSRLKWLNEDILERYWIANAYQRSRQQKDVPHPRKDTMKEVGNCRISVEPHEFEATLFVIRGGPARPQFPPSQPSTKPMLQSNTPSEPVSRQSPITLKQSSSPNPPAPNLPAPLPTPSPAIASVKGNSAPPPKQPNNAPLPPLSTALNNAPVRPQPLRQTSQDPVIQMLAQRASANPSLKELMKTVASGTAQKHDLDVFQSHIDDLNAQYQRQTQGAKLPPMGPTTFTQTPFRPNGPPAPPRSPFIGQNGFQHTNTQTTAPRPQQLIHAAQIKPPALPMQDIGGVAIEFIGGSGDRYLFPKQSILEYIPGNKQVKASFLAIRRGSSSESGEHNITKVYHVPVTILVSADNPAVLAPLSKAVAPIEEVRKNMVDAMMKTARADNYQLAIQRPLKAKGDNANSPSALGVAPGLGHKRVPRTSRLSPNPLGGRYIKSKPDIDVEQLCGCCFAELSPNQGKDADGMRVCQSCKKLREQSRVAESQPAASHLYHSMHLQSRGPRALIFSGEAR